MNEKEILRILGEVGGLRTDGHFVLSSGKHSRVYFKFSYAANVPDLYIQLAKCVVDNDFGFQIVVGRSPEGVIIAQRVAEYLAQRSGKSVMSIIIKREPGSNKQIIAPDQQKLLYGKRVLVVDDVITTGNSIMAMVSLVKSYGADVRAIAVFLNREWAAEDIPKDLPPIFSLLKYRVDSYDPNVLCPMCRDGVPIDTDVGKGQEYLERRKKI